MHVQMRAGLQAVFRRHPRAGQLPLLLLSVLFVGAAVGAERSVLPLLAASEFGIGSATAALSFLVAFGSAKAAANLAAGGMADRVGRRNVLLLAWLLGLPVPFLLLVAPSWTWIGVANLLLGANQGLAWSALQIMKIDLVGRRRRGVAMGANECVGYLAVASAALAGSALVPVIGAREALFVVPFVAAVLGLFTTLTLVRDSRRPARGAPGGKSGPGSDRTWLAQVSELSFGTRARLATNQAGLAVNLKEGVAWGLIPLFLLSRGAEPSKIAAVAALYPAVWGIAQLGTGALSDRWGRRSLVTLGMSLQAASLGAVALAESYAGWSGAVVLMGLGTAAAYPTLIAQASDLAAADERASAIGVYRLWRDSGYVVGGLSAGLAADLFGYGPAILLVALVVAASALLAHVHLPAPALFVPATERSGAPIT